MQKNKAEYYIKQLDLAPHPEGGYYKSTYNSAMEMDVGGKNRKLYTSIYFLLTSEEISHFHRLKSDELWYYHGGSSLIVHVIDKLGEYKEFHLGLNLDEGEAPQILVPRDSIFASTVKEGGDFSLVGCMVAPGFDFEDFELFEQHELLSIYPQHEQIIRKHAYQKN